MKNNVLFSPDTTIECDENGCNVVIHTSRRTFRFPPQDKVAELKNVITVPMYIRLENPLTPPYVPVRRSPFRIILDDIMLGWVATDAELFEYKKQIFTKIPGVVFAGNVVVDPFVRQLAMCQQDVEMKSAPTPVQQPKCRIVDSRGCRTPTEFAGVIFLEGPLTDLPRLLHGLKYVAATVVVDEKVTTSKIKLWNDQCKQARIYFAGHFVDHHRYQSDKT